MVSEDINILELKEDIILPDVSLADSLHKGMKIKLLGTDILNIKWMDVKDVSDVLLIERETFPDPWSKENFLYRIGDKNYNVSLTGCVKGSSVAYTVSYIVGDELHFMNLAVKKPYRRNKIGELLLLMSLSIAKENNCLWVHLEVRKSNLPAIQLYEKLGFEDVGVRKNYYKEENEDALLMSKSI